MEAAPTVYFIDDSATMREVIKIAFRRENMNVVACHDAVLALEEIEKNRPDIVITDVIMPAKDGYEVCEHIKSREELSSIPVVLMSGVVNRAVAERAFAVKADELIRKPFQPQDLITRVKHLLGAPGAPAPVHVPAASAADVLSSIFSAPAPMPPRAVVHEARPLHAGNGHSHVAALAAPVAVAPSPATTFPVTPAFPVVETDEGEMPLGGAVAASSAETPVVEPAPAPPAPATAPAPRTNGSDPTKMRVEVLRLEGLAKKLQAELAAEREYSRALEAHIKTLQESEG